MAAKERINKTTKIADDYLDTIVSSKSKPRIPFGSLVELGIIKPGTSLFDPQKKINVKIMADGSIKYKDTEGSIHKIAAKIMGAESYNGWTYWHYNFNGFLPTLAQGAGQSIESAYELFNLIKDYKAEIQNTYFKERSRRAKIVKRRSNINFFVFHFSSSIMQTLRNFFMKFLVKRKSFVNSYLGIVYKN